MKRYSVKERAKFLEVDRPLRAAWIASGLRKETFLQQEGLYIDTLLNQAQFSTDILREAQRKSA